MAKPPSNSVHPKSRQEWRRWLDHNHARTEGIWLITYKKASGKPRIEYAEAVEEALCFGWIDSKPARLDEERSMLWFTPRKPRTGWSRINKQRVARLNKAGLMAPAGLAKVTAAKKDGSWNALDAAEALEIPPDLDNAFAGNQSARDYFEAFPPSAKKAILQWILSAKQPQTRAKRIEETVAKAAGNIRANQWRR